MTKIYPIISLNGEMYMVDPKAHIKKGEWYIFSFDGVVQLYNQANEQSEYYFKIIATTDKSLGLSLLPSIEDEMYMGLKTRPGMLGLDEKEHEAFLSGYRLAASKKQYTEEDMRQAYAEGILNQQKRSLYGNFEQFINSLESLKPIPTAIEVEMYEDTDNGNPAFGGYDCPNVPKVDKQNYIIVKKWIYDEES